MLTVLATDPAAPRDFRAFCDEAGHSIAAETDSGGVYTITLRKKD